MIKKKNHKMVISSRVHLGWMECPGCNSLGRGGETSKWQWVNSKLVSFRSGFRIHELNFEIISKRPFNFVQLFPNGHNFFISDLICTPFEALDS